MHELLTDLPADSLKPCTVIAKGDSGATNHCWRPEDKHVLDGIKKDTSIKVTLPNSQGMQSAGKGTLLISKYLSNKAQQATVLPQLSSSSLMSLGKFCDDDCKVELDKSNLKVFKEKKLVMKGYRNQKDGLWDMPMTNPIVINNVKLPQTHPGMYHKRSKSHEQWDTSLTPKCKPKESSTTKMRDESSEDIDQLLQEFTSKDNKANAIVRKKQTKSTLASYLHACCLNPVITTFTRAIANNNFITWPGLTVNLIQKHLAKSMHAYQGHMHAERKGLQSTKSKDEEKEEEMDSFPTPD